ncbi:MAG: DNA-binding protein AraC-type [Clostridiaceae bacterium]|nr:DNA-binding protein AraC-type [Clostridiaceae bacterium]
MNIQHVKNYINENLTIHISLYDIASYMNYSPYYFSRYFRKAAGETIMEYVRRQRLRAAAGELINEGCNICHLAIKYCFESQDGFCRAFQRYYGVSPGYYKKNHNKSILNDQKEMTDFNMNTLKFYKEAVCSYEEKYKLLPTIKELLNLANIARKSGIFALEDKLDKLEHQFFRKALEMIIDGTEPEILRQQLLNLAFFGGNTGYELMMRLLITEGVIAIQKGLTSYMIRDLLISYLGDDFIKESESYFEFDSDSKSKTIEKFIALTASKKVISKECSLLEEPLSKMNNRSLARLLREIDIMTLAYAIYGSSGIIQEKVLKHISERQACILIEEISGMEEIISIEVSKEQKKILEVLKSLVENGDVMV